MRSDIVIDLQQVGKCYEIFAKPVDRLKQFLFKSRTYAYKHWALNDVTLQVKRGETVGIIGRNGSGKSTLLQLICDISNPSKGQVRINGKIAALLELGAGFNPEFSGRENIYLNAMLYGLKRHEIDKLFEKIAAFADIGAFIEQPVKTYSSGMFVRLAFAVLAHVKADILIIDEALAVGDIFFTQKCLRFLEEFKRHGTIVFVSHDIAAVRSLCDRAVLLQSGNVVLIGDTKEVTERYVETVYSEQQTVQLTQGETQAFGAGKAKITNVTLIRAETGAFVQNFIGGEDVALDITVEILRDLQQPIIGFLLRDRLGQNIFGHNTSSGPFEQKNLVAGQYIKASFCFKMPVLPAGDYTITAAVATGTQHDHEQQHWIHDALALRASPLQNPDGLVGVAMQADLSIV